MSVSLCRSVSAAIVAVCILGLSIVDSKAQTTFALYEFNDNDVSPFDKQASSDTHPTSTAGTISHNAGLTNSGFSTSSDSLFVRTTGTDDPNNGAVSVNTLAGAIAADLYTTFNFTIDSGTVDLRTLSFDFYMSGFSATQEYEVAFMSSLTGFTAGNELGTANPIGSTAPGLNTIIDLTQGGTVNTFENLAPQTIEFRVYYYDDLEDTSDIYRVDNILLSDEQQPLTIDWVTDGGGDWNDPNNWGSNPAIPGVTVLNDNAVIGTVITADATINIDVNTQLNSLSINNGNDITVSGPNTITLTGDAELNSGAGDHFIEADIAGTVGLSKNGGGDITLVGAKSYTGGTDVQGGLLRVDNIDGIDNSVSGTLNVADTANLILQGDPNSTGAGFAGTIVPDITGDGTLTLSSSLTTEVVTLDSAKSFNGFINVNGGTLVVSDDDALGTADPNDLGTRTQVPGNVFINGVNTDASSQLQLSGGVNVASETLDLNDRDDGNEVAHLASVSGNNTWGGDVLLDTGGGNYTIDSTDPNGLLTISGNIVDVDDEGDGSIATVNLRGDGDGIITGNFVDQDSDPNNANDNFANIAVVKQGTGTWTIGTASSNSTDYYQGNTTVEEGTLVVQSVSGSPTQGELSSPVIDIRSGATLDASSFTRYTTQADQTIQGAGTIDVQELRIFGDDATITPGDSGVGTLTVNGDVLMDIFTDTPTGAFNFELSDSVAGANDQIVVNGTLTVNAGTASNQYLINVALTGAGLQSSTYTLIDATTLSAAGTAANSNFGVNIVDSQGNLLGATRQTFSVDLDTVADEVQLEVSGSAATQTWNGTVTNQWDAPDPNGVGGTANWTGTGNQFFTLDNAVFPDGAAQTSVNIPSPVVPSSVTFTNNADTYTFTGPAGISGGSTLSLNGTGTVILANDGNDFQGDVTIGSGATLQLGSGDPNGTAFNAIGANNNIVNNGTLVLNEPRGQGNSGEGLSGIISGTGTVRSDSANLTLSGQNTYTGPTIVNDATIQVAGLDPNGPNTQLGSAATGTTVNTGGNLRANGQVGTIAEPVTLNGGRLVVGGGTNSNLTWSSDITVGASADSEIRLEGGTNTATTNGLTVSGNVGGSNGQDLVVAADGGSTLAFTGNIAHDGALRVRSGGTVALQGSAAVTSPTIDVGNNANLDVTGTNSGAITLASGQTLDHSGEVAGNVVADSGSTIEIGGTGAATPTTESFSLNSTQDNRISFTPAAPDQDTESGTTGFQLRVGLNNSGTQVTRGVVQWDLSSIVNQFSSITSVDSASIEVLDNSDAIDGTAGAGHTLEVHELTRDFVDSEVSASEASSGVNWTGYDSTSATWAGSGDIGLLLSSFAGLVPGADTVNPLVVPDSANTRAALQNALNGTGNLNVLLKLSDVEEVPDPNGLGNSFFAFDDDNDTTPPALNFTITGEQLVGVDRGLVNGDLTLNAGSTIVFDIGSLTQFDELQINGDFTAGGTLDVNLLGSFTPSAGDVFDIFDYDPNSSIVSGAFGTLDLPALAGTLDWDTSNLLTTGELSVIDTANNADFDGDGLVNGLDFLIWQQNAGGPGTAATGDANGDGTVGSADLAIWESQYGTAPISGSVASVPEPTAAMLLISGLLGALAHRRRS